MSDLALIALLCGGHMLLDDVPGTVKTVFAKTFACALELDMRRVQCVPDMLPSDITGVNFFDMKLSEFRFVKGPAFSNILLADEINRAMPKTQAGLLECMEERQVTVDGTTYKLSEPFMVIATQNPVETKGTFELPEAELDRFLVKTGMGYPTREESVEMIERRLAGRTDADGGTVGAAELAAASAELKNVFIHRYVISYAAGICEETRRGGEVVLGASPRALIHLMTVSQGFAALSAAQYDRGFSSDGVFEGESLELVEEMHNDSWFPLLFVRLDFYIPEGQVIDGIVCDGYKKLTSVFHIPPHATVRRIHMVVGAKREHYKLETASERCAKNCFDFSCPAELYVYPERYDASGMFDIALRQAGDVIAARKYIEDPFFISGIRDYRYGDPVRSINFKASSRALSGGARSLLCNSYDSSRTFDSMIFLDLTPYAEVCRSRGTTQSCLRRACDMPVICSERQ